MLIHNPCCLHPPRSPSPAPSTLSHHRLYLFFISITLYLISIVRGGINILQLEITLLLYD